MKKGNRELQEKLMLLQKEKDQVLLFIMFITLQIDVNDIAKTHWKLTCSRHDIAEKLLSWH